MNILRSKDGVILKFCQLIKYYTIDLVLYKENVHGKKYAENVHQKLALDDYIILINSYKCFQKNLLEVRYFTRRL